MKFSPDQVRRTAKALFMDEWLKQPVEAALKAIEFLEACTDDTGPESLPEPSPMETNSSAELVNKLAELVTKKQINITAAAKAIGVHPMTLRTWIQHDNHPRPDKLPNIAQYLSELDL